MTGTLRLGAVLLFLLAAAGICPTAKGHIVDSDMSLPPALGQDALQGSPEAAPVLGDVHFPTSCSPAAQAEFDHGVAWLHSFGREPALETFAAVAASDPGCAMAYWGIAMATFMHPFIPPRPRALQEGWAAVERARSLGAPTQRERDYVEAIAAFYRGPEDQSREALRARRVAYAEAMEDLYLRYPADPEAAIFYAISMSIAMDPFDTTHAWQLKVGAILERLFTEQPNHPGVAHYLIHTYDDPQLADRGLEAARRYAAIAPSSPHALHMPSHIFTQLGLWEESIATNRPSLAAETAPGGEIHSLDYLVYAHLQLGQDAAARSVVERAAELQTSSGSTNDAAAIPARYALERRQWAEAVALAPRRASLVSARGITFAARALGAARSGDLGAARENIDTLATVRESLLADGVEYWADQTDIARLEAAAWLAAAEGRRDEAVQLMVSAADREDAAAKSGPGPVLPARELLGELLLELGDPEAALQAFEASVRSNPNRLRGLFGAARAAELSGDHEKALRYYRDLLMLTRNADTDRPEMQQARAFLGV